MLRSKYTIIRDTPSTYPALEQSRLRNVVSRGFYERLQGISEDESDLPKE